MALQTFDFLVVDQHKWPAHHATLIVEGNQGGDTRRALLPAEGRYRVIFDILVPGNSKTVDDWHTFVRTHQGAYTAFKYKEKLRDLYRQLTDENLGTGDGIETDFPIPVKYVDGSATITVKVGGTPTASGWSIVNNETAPILRFSVAPSSGAITISCEFFIPCYFAVDPDHGEWTGADEDSVRSIELVEEYAGAHRDV